MAPREPAARKPPTARSARTATAQTIATSAATSRLLGAMKSPGAVAPPISSSIAEIATGVSATTTQIAHAEATARPALEFANHATSRTNSRGVAPLATRSTTSAARRTSTTGVLPVRSRVRTILACRWIATCQTSQADVRDQHRYTRHEPVAYPRATMDSRAHPT